MILLIHFMYICTGSKQWSGSPAVLIVDKVVSLFSCVACDAMRSTLRYSSCHRAEILHGTNHADYHVQQAVSNEGATC